MIGLRYTKMPWNITLIEVMIILAIVGILLSIWLGGTAPIESVSNGINGRVEERCIGGFRFIVGSGGKAEQLLGEDGGGIRCEIERRP